MFREKWQRITGYENEYLVSNKGRIFSLHSRGMKVLKLTDNRAGYAVIKLNKDGVGISKTVHRLVAAAFLTADETRHHINHLDGDKKNNAVSNLQRCTPSENALHAHRTGLANANHLKVKVLKYDLNGTLINEFDSLTAAYHKTGCFQSNIRAVCKGKRRTTGGYKWQYKDTTRGKEIC